MNNNEAAAETIATAYDLMADHADDSRWVSITKLAEYFRLIGQTFTAEEWTAGFRILSRREGWNVAPESNTKLLTQEDHDAAVGIGGQWKHLICRN